MRKLSIDKPMKHYCAAIYTIILASMMIALSPARSRAQVVAVPPYTVTTFATAPTGLSAPDSITFSSTNVFVGYGNGGAPDGSDGAMSNVVEYDFKGNLIQNFKNIVG